MNGLDRWPTGQDEADEVIGQDKLPNPTGGLCISVEVN